MAPRNSPRMLAAILIIVASLPSNLLAQPSNIYVEPSKRLARGVVSVQPGQTIHYELPLTQGTKLVAEFLVQGGLDNRVNVWLFDRDNFQRFWARQSASGFKGASGTISGVAKFGFTIPTTGTYYLVLDNRKSPLFARDVQVYAYALLPAADASTQAIQQRLERFYQGLKHLFIFPEFGIAVRRCGFANARSNPNITLCDELIEQLVDKQLGNAATFVVIHELGHTLLRLWKYPLSDNEEVADEFATVFLLIGKQRDAALEAASWFASQGSEAEAKRKLSIDDRHTIGPQRARNIISWLNGGDELLRKWQKILVPNMQTAALQSLDQSTEGWVDRPLVQRELAGRAAPPQERTGPSRSDGLQPPSATSGTDGGVSSPGNRTLTMEGLENLAYRFGDKVIPLTNGRYESRKPRIDPDYLMLAFERATHGDLDGDGVDDAAVILVSSGGGSGTFYHLAAVLNRSPKPIHVASVDLGDRVAIIGLTISSGRITLEMLTQGPNDASCCPTQRVTQVYGLSGDKLIRRQ